MKQLYLVRHHWCINGVAEDQSTDIVCVTDTLEKAMEIVREDFKKNKGRSPDKVLFLKNSRADTLEFIYKDTETTAYCSEEHSYDIDIITLNEGLDL